MERVTSLAVGRLKARNGTSHLFRRAVASLARVEDFVRGNKMFRAPPLIPCFLLLTSSRALKNELDEQDRREGAADGKVAE